ncbi:patatin-like phospholipase family protein [Streptomyces sp. SID5785]|uniref:patatin-like phospholipase family protein n=1 Tax=Streptomyces sp. SID5785 TaxID=2690309 RepID=UPI001360B960|nr:patatin-like phospholipase family protein [Streptomyces sp. SID5785]MZD04716.1 patatin-like phospholipase family protein [Streptomyces sp. SID5785]
MDDVPQTGSTPAPRPDARSALVLGGGGPVGGAWLTGVLAGLAGAGVDLDRFDLVTGASAGAVFGARLASGESARALYDRQLAGADRIDLDVTLGQTLRFLWAAARSRRPDRAARNLGRAALAARTCPESEVLDAVCTLLGGVRDWPGRPLRIAAVEASTGQEGGFDRDAGVPLVEAVAASCAVPLVWPPVTAGGRRWIDGGSRSSTPFRLAHDHGRILAVTPLPSAIGPHPHAARQAADLIARGTAVRLLTPDDGARHAMGRDMTANDRRADSAAAGHAQGTAAAASVLALLDGAATPDAPRRRAHG